MGICLKLNSASSGGALPAKGVLIEVAKNL